MELALNNAYLETDKTLESILSSIRDEIFSAIHSAMVNKAFDKDVSLSFGNIHINPAGSISTISFNGNDVTDMDKFVATKAFKVKEENYFDIRSYIKKNTMEFCFYPLKSNDKITYTVLKRSKYFINKFGALVDDHDRFRIRYTPKYIVVSVFECDKWENYVFVVDLYREDQKSKLLIADLIRRRGFENIVYSCFSNDKPQIFLAIGYTQNDFIGYRITKKSFNFYYSSILNLMLSLYRKKNKKNEPLVLETKKFIFQLIIENQFGGIKNFCEMKDIEMYSLKEFLNSKESYFNYKNGDSANLNRLQELLNIKEEIDESHLKLINLLKKVEYDDIPIV